MTELRNFTGRLSPAFRNVLEQALQHLSPEVVETFEQRLVAADRSFFNDPDEAEEVLSFEEALEERREIGQEIIALSRISHEIHQAVMLERYGEVVPDYPDSHKPEVTEGALSDKPKMTPSF